MYFTELYYALEPSLFLFDAARPVLIHQIHCSDITSCSSTSVSISNVDYKGHDIVPKLN
jgi:hypothetical protein